MPLRGRCVAIEDAAQPASAVMVVRNAAGVTRAVVATPHAAQVGDLVEVRHRAVHVLTANRTPTRAATWMERVLDPRRLHALEVRERVEAAIHRFLRERGFRETRTPLLVPNPGMDPHIRPFRVTPHAGHHPAEATAYLPTSPELAMKRLLAGGLDRIYQITPAFRSEPASRTHRPEFTMLELYRAYADDEDLRADVEALLAHVATSVHGRPETSYGGRRISFAAPWPRLTIRGLFEAHAGIDLARAGDVPRLRDACERIGVASRAEDSWDDLFFRVWLDRIEPELPRDRAVFVCRYPASQAALAVVDDDPDGTRWARRFECFAGGFELGNAFEELTDPAEQRARFAADMRERTRAHGDEILPNEPDEGFLEALEEGMPPAAGIAIGVDRLVMLLADEADIDFTFWLPAAGE
ncbi:MAG: EF-P lysine aminoacylase EpmA [bacterium]